MKFVGILLSIDQEVAMKFTPVEHEFYAKHEYEIYACLDAINNTKIEAFGIPSVYYYGRWNGHILMAITLLDTKLNAEQSDHQLNEADILIIFLEFVSIFVNQSRSLNTIFLLIPWFCTKRDWKIFVFAMCSSVHVEADLFKVAATVVSNEYSNFCSCITLINYYSRFVIY